MTRWFRWVLAPFDILALATMAKSFEANPVIGNRTLNRWGLHLLRKRIALRLGDHRRRSLAVYLTPEDRAAFDRDGFLVKRNFLDPNTFARMRDEILSFETEAREAVIGDMLTRLIPLDAITLPRLPVTREILEGPRFRRLIDYAGSFRRRPHLFIQTVFSRVAEGPPDVQSFFHSDTFHPTMKAWFFLNDVAEDANPFTYVPGSHRPTRRRLAWERRVSMTAARAGDRLTAEGSLRVSESELRHFGYPAPQKLAVGANTLIVADTSGIHKRGTSRDPATRISIWAYSRSNPFLPWVGGDIAGLPMLSGRLVRLMWALDDTIKDLRRARREWRWVGTRTASTPPVVP